MGRVNYKGEVYESKEVVSKLVDFLTPERLEKINRVVGQRSDGFIAVLENLYDRGNVSAVMRSSEAFGFYKIHVIQTDKAFKESKRVTQGADKWLEVDKWSETQSCVEFLKNHGYTVLTTSLNDDDNKNDNNKNDGNKNDDNKNDNNKNDGNKNGDNKNGDNKDDGNKNGDNKDGDNKNRFFMDLDFNQKTAVILGNEKDGVSKEALELSDGNVRIPMEGFTQSFNISVAAALCFFFAKLKSPPLIEHSEQERLKALYILTTLNWPTNVLTEIFSC